MKKLASSGLVVAVLAAFALAIPAVTFAALTPNLTQTVNPGVLSADIFAADGTTPVASPSVAFSAVNKSFSCQTSTGTLGSNTERLYVSNLGSNSGFTLAVAPTSGASATWSDGATNTYDFNDPAGTTAGCTNGQLSVDASVGTVTTDCNSSCDGVTVNKGAADAFDAVTPSITILSTNSGSGWKGYLTGVALSQKIPANQANANYSLGMTLTATAQ